VVFLNDLLRSGFDIRFVSTIEDYELFKIGKDYDSHSRIPPVADGLEAIIGRRKVTGGLFGFGEKSGVTKVWVDIESIIGVPLRLAGGKASFNFDLLSEGVLLFFMVNVPVKCNEEFVDEIFADF